MVALTQQIKDAMPKTGYFFGTCSKAGVPHVNVLGGVKLLDDENILVVDNFFYKTAKNLEENPHVAISFWNPEEKAAYQIKGIATIYKGDKIFDGAVLAMHNLNPQLNPKAAVVVKVTDVFDLKRIYIIGQFLQLLLIL